MPLARKTAPPPTVGVNLFDPALYAGGFGLPEGDYLWTNLEVKIHQPTNPTTGANAGPAKLGVMISMRDVSGDNHDRFYAMGTNADKSFAPNPDTGKGMLPIAGASGATINDKTNWFLLQKSLLDSGLAETLPDFDGSDLSPLEGLTYHMVPQDEPAERKGFAQTTGEFGGDQKKFGNKVLVVTEIKETPAAAAPKKGPVAVAPKAAAKPGLKAAVKPAPAPEPEGADEEAIMIAASAGAADVLERNQNGCGRPILRMGVFKYVKANDGDDMAQAVVSTFFGGDDDSLNLVLGPLGFKVTGAQITVA